jgi:hypothetical protein
MSLTASSGCSFGASSTSCAAAQLRSCACGRRPDQRSRARWTQDQESEGEGEGEAHRAAVEQAQRRQRGRPQGGQPRMQGFKQYYQALLPAAHRSTAARGGRARLSLRVRLHACHTLGHDCDELRAQLVAVEERKRLLSSRARQRGSPCQRNRALATGVNDATACANGGSLPFGRRGKQNSNPPAR